MLDKSKLPEPFEQKVWLSSPTMHGEELEYVRRAYETNWMSTVGENVDEVERLSAEACGRAHGVALSCGTAALHLAVKLAGVKPGDEVLCSDMTFAATVNPVVYEGGIPVFVDTERDTWNMDPEALERAFELHPGARAVMLAHLYGTPAKMDEIVSIAHAHGAAVIEDAAEALGATYKGRPAGSFGDVSVVSFNGNKIITGSSGGALLTDDPDAAAKARKLSPLMEADAREAVQNNVFGTLNVAQMAHDRGCTHFVLVSTDKAVNPTNFMGATKRMCETVVQSFAQRGSKTVFTAVRFGNVLGSHGSVIPLFKRQLKEGGPITVTHKDITRYFMTIPEASRLVITAGALAKGGEVFVLKMGDPVRIYDLACNLVRLSGLRLGRDIEIKVTGLRPGEKLYEELRMEGEDVIPTDVDDITVSTGSPVPPEQVDENLAALEACLEGENDHIKRALAKAVPTYRPQLAN